MVTVLKVTGYCADLPYLLGVDSTPCSGTREARAGSILPAPRILGPTVTNHRPTCSPLNPCRCRRAARRRQAVVRVRAPAGPTIRFLALLLASMPPPRPAAWRRQAAVKAVRHPAGESSAPAALGYLTRTRGLALRVTVGGVTSESVILNLNTNIIW